MKPKKSTCAMLTVIASMGLATTALEPVNALIQQVTEHFVSTSMTAEYQEHGTCHVETLDTVMKQQGYVSAAQRHTLAQTVP